MWVGKFKIRHDDWILKSTLKYNITVRGVPVNSFEKGGKKYHTAFIFVQGKEENRKKFIESLKNNRKVKEFHVKANQVLVLVEGEDAISHYYLHSFFLIQPVLLKEGYEWWEVGSWDRKSLMEFYGKIKKIAEVELLKLKKEMPSVFVQYAVPKLTEKQRKAIELAEEMGYYSYPRKISVEEIAQKAGIPRTTFQEHLRKAESKLMNFVLQSEIL